MKIDPVTAKMIVMMLMMLTGVFCAKLHITGPAFNRQVNSFVMNILLVCTILNAVLTAKERVSGVVLAEYLGVLILMYVISMLIATVSERAIPGPPEDRIAVWGMVAFSNNVFIGFPLTEAVFGPDAVFYAALSPIPFNLFMYSVYVAKLNPGEGRRFDWRRMVTPPLIAAFVAVILYLTDIRFPEILTETIGTFSGAMLPMSMIILGTSLGSVPAKEAFTNPKVYLTCLLRLIVVPVAVWAVLRLFVTDPMMLGIPVLLIACPGSAILPAICIQYGKNDTFCAQQVFVSTVLSVVTIPALVAVLF